MGWALKVRKPYAVNIQVITLTWSSKMSGLKLRLMLCAAVLLPIAAASAAQTQRGAALVSAARGDANLQAIQAGFAWTRKWHRRQPPKESDAALVTASIIP